MYRWLLGKSWMMKIWAQDAWKVIWLQSSFIIGIILWIHNFFLSLHGNVCSSRSFFSFSFFVWFRWSLRCSRCPLTKYMKITAVKHLIGVILTVSMNRSGYWGKYNGSIIILFLLIRRVMERVEGRRKGQKREGWYGKREIAWLRECPMAILRHRSSWPVK